MFWYKIAKCELGLGASRHLCIDARTNSSWSEILHTYFTLRGAHRGAMSGLKKITSSTALKKLLKLLPQESPREKIDAYRYGH